MTFDPAVLAGLADLALRARRRQAACRPGVGAVAAPAGAGERGAAGGAGRVRVVTGIVTRRGHSGGWLDGGERPGGAVPGGVAGDSVEPAAPDDPDPGAGELLLRGVAEGGEFVLECFHAGDRLGGGGGGVVGLVAFGLGFAAAVDLLGEAGFGGGDALVGGGAGGVDLGLGGLGVGGGAQLGDGAGEGVGVLGGELLQLAALRARMSCVRCPQLRPDPAQEPRLTEIGDNLEARIAEARREGWLGEIAGLEATLEAAKQKLQAMQQIAARHGVTNLGMPAFRDTVGRSST